MPKTNTSQLQIRRSTYIRQKLVQDFAKTAAKWIDELPSVDAPDATRAVALLHSVSGFPHHSGSPLPTDACLFEAGADRFAADPCVLRDDRVGRVFACLHDEGAGFRSVRHK